MPIQRLPEGPADGHVGVPGKRLRDDLGRLRKIELVQVQIHTLWGCGEARRSQLRGQRKRPQRPRQAARRGRGEREAAEGAADAAEAGELPGGAQDEALGARRHQRRGRPNPQRRPSREHGGGPATPRERGTAGQAAATAHGCAREAEAIDAEVHTPVQAERHLRKVLSSLHRRSELSVLHREMGEAAVVPQLRYLHTARWRLLQCEVEPLLAQTDAGFQQVLCHDRSLCNLAQLADHAPALGDEVEVSGEGFCVPDQRMPRPRHGRVLEAARAVDLLPGLHAQRQGGRQDAVLRNLHLCLPHNKPLTARPRLLRNGVVTNLHAALHAKHRLLVCPHGQLFQMVVRLEHHLTNAGTREPLGLEALHLHGVLGMAGAALRAALGVDGVQREEGLGALAPAHLQGDREILQVDGARGLDGRHHLHSVVLLQHQAAHTPRCESTSQLLRRLRIPRDAPRLPTDVELLVARLLQTGLALQPALLLAPQLADEILCPALTVHEVRCVLAVAVGQLSQGQATVVTQGASLAIGIGLLGLVLRLPRALLKHGPPTQVLLELGAHDPLGLLRHGGTAPEWKCRPVEPWHGADGGCGLAAAFQELRVQGQSLLAGSLPLLLLGPLAVVIAAQVGSTRRLEG
mmetsp:Transcript_134457/g.429444  ORF Transcript_134457/g.429444 Transcript_134457/m.429444 type:complete len:632 (-) Transcript_134457:398-2293(-)